MAKEINCESFVQWLFDEQDMFRRHFGQIHFTRKKWNPTSRDKDFIRK